MVVGCGAAHPLAPRERDALHPGEGTLRTPSLPSTDVYKVRARTRERRGKRCAVAYSAFHTWAGPKTKPGRIKM